ncbi:MAG TPA: prolyl oligopeptidase family serine peptidase [Fimbriimonadaceae bacterium]|nr:prolyl oligopeptidase family serine peptidase [Fimbriimonadaceae bacterium]
MNLKSSLFVFACLFVQVASAQPAPSFDDLYPRRPFTGKSAVGMEWSHDDRYLAYLWNPYKAHSMDIWVYDTQSGKSTQLTSIELMKPFDRDIPKAIERYKTEDEELDRADRMSDLEYREWTLKKKKEAEDRKEPLPSYPGISGFEWAKKSDEMLFTYKGDIYRMKIGDARPSRLTQTRDAESQPEYAKEDQGFYYRRGDGVYYCSFNSPVVRQLNPELPNNMPLQGYMISPAGDRLVIFTGRSIAPDRQVDYIVYRNRFAEAKKAPRGVADDKFNEESYVYLYDLNDDPEANPRNDGKPWEVWKFPGGDEYQETSVNSKPWSPDGKQFVFASWKRTKKELAFWVADAETKTLKQIYKTGHDGEHRSPSLASPFFSPDSTKVICMLENSGFRQAWSIDPNTQTETQITKGDFETYPIELSKDGKTLFVRSGKDSPAQMQLYKVDMSTGDYTKFTGQAGNYGDTVNLNHDQSEAAVRFANWNLMGELYLVPTTGGKEMDLTESHRKEDFEKVNRLKPQLFTYQNRHGQTIHGFMFVPKDLKSKKTKRPLMIYVYGGPLGSDRSVVDGSFNSTAYLFNQYLTLKYGFVTVTIDPRGQSGYGTAFGKANWDAPGVAQVEDLSDGVKYLIENYNVDPKKVAVNGWSFGGFQTQMCMYTAPDVFTLGIAGAGPTEWQNYNNWYSGGVIGTSRIGKPEDLDKYSLTNLAKNLKSPLMLLHGMEDTNVLFQDTVKVYRKLLQYGKGDLVELALDPTGGHGMGGDMNTRDRHAIYLQFIKKWWRLDD